MKNSYLTITDQFCGAGGSSQGARNVANKLRGGLEIKLALNHWKLAIETHNTNFPDTLHDCTDVSACDPRRYPSTDILITSPECTTHSPAGGNFYRALKQQMDMFDKGVIDPSADRSRATMWDVCRFAEYHNYNIIIVENVVEAKTRWPLFDTWLRAMHVLGYDHKCLYINSMHCHPTPQSRDRMYVVFWKKGNKAPDLDFRPVAFCQSCDKQVKAFQWWKNQDYKFGKYRSQYLYRCPDCTSVVEPYYFAAFNIIDWSIPGISVLDRPKPLSPNTIKRIEYGLEKFGDDVMIITGKYVSGVGSRVKSASQSTLPTQPGEGAHYLLNPFLMNTYFGGINKGLQEPYPTQTCQDSHGIVLPFMIQTDNASGKNSVNTRSGLGPSRTVTTADAQGVVMPAFLVKNYGGGFDPKHASVNLNNPTGTITTTDHHAVVHAPFIVENYGQSKSKQITRPFPPVTTEMKHGIINPEAFSSFLTYYYGNSMANSGLKPAGTITTIDRVGLVKYKKPTLEDCTYRTIRPHEVKAAMAFDQDYIVLGNGKKQVKQLGNAVTPPVMEWLVERCAESLM